MTSNTWCYDSDKVSMLSKTASDSGPHLRREMTFVYRRTTHNRKREGSACACGAFALKRTRVTVYADSLSEPATFTILL